MRRLIHLFMGVGREEARRAETAPAFEDRLRATVQKLDGELGEALSELSTRASERNRVRAEADRLRARADALHADAKDALVQDEARARGHLKEWARVRQVADGVSAELERLNSARVSIEARVADLRTRLDESRRNTSTLLARRSASRAQQRLADAVVAGHDQSPGGVVASGAGGESTAIEVEEELRRLRDELKG